MVGGLSLEDIRCQSLEVFSDQSSFTRDLLFLLVVTRLSGVRLQASSNELACVSSSASHT